jgi:hypothetical protein
MKEQWTKEHGQKDIVFFTRPWTGRQKDIVFSSARGREDKKILFFSPARGREDKKILFFSPARGREEKRYCFFHPPVDGKKKDIVFSLAHGREDKKNEAIGLVFFVLTREKPLPRPLSTGEGSRAKRKFFAIPQGSKCMGMACVARTGWAGACVLIAGRTDYQNR